MRAVMLAAGIGQRLFGGEGVGSKALLDFEGATLLERHIEILASRGIDQLDLVVGHRADALADEIERIGAGSFVRAILNPDYRRGSLLSLWAARASLGHPDGVLVMDADVLYHPALIDRLIGSPHASCLLLDRDFEPGEEPVKVGIRAGDVVEFRKQINGVALDLVGEWPGFLKLSPTTAGALLEVAAGLIAADQLDAPMEEAVRGLILRQPARVGWADITGLPWIEIDFAADVSRATREILPRIGALESFRRNGRFRADGVPGAPELGQDLLLGVGEQADIDQDEHDQDQVGVPQRT